MSDEGSLSKEDNDKLWQDFHLSGRAQQHDIIIHIQPLSDIDFDALNKHLAIAITEAENLFKNRRRVPSLSELANGEKLSWCCKLALAHRRLKFRDGKGESVSMRMNFCPSCGREV